MLDEHRPRRRTDRLAQLREVLADERERCVVHDLEAGEPGTETLVRVSEQLDRRGERRQRRLRRHRCARPRVQPQRGGGDDRERAFAADDEVAQVVAGVVLAQAAEAVPDAAVGRDRLDAEAELARVAVAQDLRAAGVRREVAADRAAALGGEAEREEEAVRRGFFLDALQHAAGFDDHRQVGAVDAANPVQPRGRQQYLAAARVRNRGADEPGVAALRNERRTVVAACGDDRGDLRGRARAHDRERAPEVALAPVDLVRGAVRADEHVGVADRGGEVVEQAHGGAGTALPVRSRARTWTQHAAKSTSASTSSAIASDADTPRSLVARSAPSAA